MSASIHADVKGDGSSVIALLHGFGDTYLAWSDIRRRLPASVKTIAYDFPGHGGSLDHPAAGQMRAAAAAIIADLKERGINQVSLVGHSMGGAAAVLTALEDPSIFVSLTLLAPGGFGSEINQRLLKHYASARTAEEIRNALENMYGWNNAVGDEAVERHVAMRAVDGQTERLIEIADGMARNGKQGVLPRENLASLTMPVKVLWGTQDRVLPTRQAHRLPPMFASHIFEDTGHMLPAEIPDAATALILQNLR